MICIKVIGKPLYQWNTGRQLVLDKDLASRIDNVQIYMDGDKEGLVVLPLEEDEQQERRDFHWAN